MNVTGTEALPSHVAAFARRMRAADRAEALAFDGMEPTQALRESMKRSVLARAVFIGDEPLAMFGVVQLSGNWAQPWCLTTSAVDEHPMAFWRASKLVVGELSKMFPALCQCIDARYSKALRWAERLGFEVDADPHVCGKAQLPFHRATLITKAAGA